MQQTLLSIGDYQVTRNIPAGDLAALEDGLSAAPLALPGEKFACIVIDPPWHLRKIPVRYAPNQRGWDYSTMSVDEIAAMPIRGLALPDCWLFLWTTQKYFPYAFHIMAEWGDYVATLVWHKNGGFQPFNRPPFNREFVLLGAVRQPATGNRERFFTAFFARRRGTSVKPPEFYDTLRRVTAAPRLDMFGRRDIPRFDS